MIRSRWLVWLLRSALGLLTLIVLLLLIGAALIRTESGTRFMLQQGLPWSPVPVTVGRTEGSLNDNLTLYDLHVETDGVDVNIARLDIRLTLSALLRAAVNVERIATNGLHVTIKAGDAPPEPTPLTVATLRTPVPITIEELTLANTTITTSSDLLIA